MKIIDAHVHTNFEHKKAKEFAKENKVDFSWKAMQKAMKEEKIEAIIAITTATNSETPGESDMLLEQADKDERIKPVCSINPNFADQTHLDKIENLMIKKDIYGIKIFPGYHPVFPNDEKYFQFYELAGKYDVPVIIHTGDTFGSHHLVKYAHPLPIDEIAVKFRETKFIIAHIGNPWVRDATELVYKNENVYADISAFCIGCKKKTPEYVINDIRYALEASEDPEKFLYGSDWPLIGIANYINLMKEAVPKKYHDLVFYRNAKRIFGI